MAGVPVQLCGNVAVLKTLPVNFSSSGDNVVIPNISGLIIRVYRIWFVVAAATNITFQRGTTVLSGTIDMSDNGSLVFDFDGEPWFATQSDQEAFVINSSAGVNVGGQVYYDQTYP